MNFKKYGITIEKKIHSGYVEHMNFFKKSEDKEILDKMKSYTDLIKKTHPMGYFGKWQYIYTSKKGKISLIQLLDYHRIGEHQWEIFCMDDEKTNELKKSFSDVERFINRFDAVKRIVELLR